MKPPAIRHYACTLLFCVTTAAAAGDMAELPASDAGFREKILAFIKPGNRLEDALAILIGNGFRCSSAPVPAAGPVCLRDDREAGSTVIRRYQVRLEADGGRIKAVRTRVD